MFVDNDALGAFDAVLAACAVRAGIETLVSADTAFAGLADV
jgi:predicted nucleic acid-binding protein